MDREKFIHKSFSQQGEDLLLRRILHRKLNLPESFKGFYVDVGAHHPYRDSNTQLLYEAGWRGLNLDIQKKSVELLKEARPHDVCVQTAVSDNEGFITSYINPDKLSVVCTCDPEIAANMRKRGIKLVEERVEQSTVDSLLQKHFPKQEQIDFLNIDVEGFELKVLGGFSIDRYRPRVIGIEIHAEDLTKALSSEIAKYLMARKYQCVGASAITFFFVREGDAELRDSVPSRATKPGKAAAPGRGAPASKGAPGLFHRIVKGVRARLAN